MPLLAHTAMCRTALLTTAKKCKQLMYAQLSGGTGQLDRTATFSNNTKEGLIHGRQGQAVKTFQMNKASHVQLHISAKPRQQICRCRKEMSGRARLGGGREWGVTANGPGFKR